MTSKKRKVAFDDNDLTTVAKELAQITDTRMNLSGNEINMPEKITALVAMVTANYHITNPAYAVAPLPTRCSIRWYGYLP